MPMNCLTPSGEPFALLAAAAEGVGELDFASTEWIDEARTVLEDLVKTHAAGLEGVSFSICEVAHNAPYYLHAGSQLAWHAKFDGASVEVGAGELGSCDLKIQGDHGVISNGARIQYAGRDPAVVAAAQAIIQRVGRFDFAGAMPTNPTLGLVLRELHDAMAPRVLPKFPWCVLHHPSNHLTKTTASRTKLSEHGDRVWCRMSAPWVASARQIAYERAQLPEYQGGLASEDFIFAEEFRNPPKYTSPDGVNGGFFVVVKGGVPTVGHGPLPDVYGPADVKTIGEYAAVLPVGRTVVANDTDEDKLMQAEYSSAAFATELTPPGERNVIAQFSPSKSASILIPPLCA